MVKETTKTSKKGNNAVKSNAPMISIIILSMLVIGGVIYAGYSIFGAVTPADTIADEFEIIPYDALDSSNTEDLEDEVEYAWYRASVDGLTEEEIEDLTWADFSADGTGDNKDPDEDYVYIVKIYDSTSSDIVEQYWCSDSRIFESKMPVLQLGENRVGIYNETEDVSLVAYAREGGVVFNQTNYREWTVLWNCLDASEGTGEWTADEGYKGYFDPSVNKYKTLTMKITFNTTASTSYCELQNGYTNRETASGNDLYIEIDVNLSGTLETEIKFSSVLGTTFEAVTCSIGYGNADSYSAWDTQTN
jgi:hypothetical protein